MAERKLNFNAPLLSVRRYSNTTSSDGAKGKKVQNSEFNRRHTLPVYRSKVSMDQATEPVAVPFHWEQIPGRPKDGNMPEAEVEEASGTPRVPPGKNLYVAKQYEEKKSEEKSLVCLPVEGRSSNDNVMERDCSKEENGKAGVAPVGDDDDDDNDDAYSDALDTLSPTDSFSMNCSATDLSGTDGKIMKPSGTFSTDPQTRDFMMSRFLPAAKAMTLQPVNHASRKQPVAVEQPRQVIKVVNNDRRPLLNSHEALVMPHYNHATDQDESDDECDEYDDSGNISSKACGFLPRLCFKNSLYLLNPVPGMKVRTKASLLSTHDYEKSSKVADIKSHSLTMKKKPSDRVQSPRRLEVENKLTSGSNRYAYSIDGVQSPRTSPFRRSGSSLGSDRQIMSRISPFRRTGGTPANDQQPKGRISPLRRPGSTTADDQQLTDRISLLRRLGGKTADDQQPTGRISPLRRLGCTTAVDQQPMGRISPLKRLGCTTIDDPPPLGGRISPLRRSGSISPCRNEAPQSPFRGSRFLGLPKEAENYRAMLNVYSKCSSKSQELTSSRCTKPGSYSASPAIEKTLFVDTVNRTTIPHATSGSSDIKHCKDSSSKYSKTSLKSGEMEETMAAECSSEDAKCPRKEVNLEYEFQESSNDSKALVCVSATPNGIQSAIAPQLPKSPSESWLWRTLPSISSQNPSSQFYRASSLQNRCKDPKTSSTNTKWETIVKSSYSHHDHMRYSEELVPHASQQSKC